MAQLNHLLKNGARLNERGSSGESALTRVLKKALYYGSPIDNYQLNHAMKLIGLGAEIGTKEQELITQMQAAKIWPVD